MKIEDLHPDAQVAAKILLGHLGKEAFQKLGEEANTLFNHVVALVDAQPVTLAAWSAALVLLRAQCDKLMREEAHQEQPNLSDSEMRAVSTQTSLLMNALILMHLPKVH